MLCTLPTSDPVEKNSPLRADLVPRTQPQAKKPGKDSAMARSVFNSVHLMYGRKKWCGFPPSEALLKQLSRQTTYFQKQDQVIRLLSGSTVQPAPARWPLCAQIQTLSCTGGLVISSSLSPHLAGIGQPCSNPRPTPPESKQLEQRLQRNEQWGKLDASPTCLSLTHVHGIYTYWCIGEPKIAFHLCMTSWTLPWNKSCVFLIILFLCLTCLTVVSQC